MVTLVLGMQFISLSVGCTGLSHTLVGVVRDFVYVVIVSCILIPLCSSGIVCVYVIILMCFSCPVVAMFIALPLIFTPFLTWFLFCFS